MERYADEVDVAIVGGGPAGLSAAIRLMQNAEREGAEIRVCVIEKGPEIGEYYIYDNCTLKCEIAISITQACRSNYYTASFSS